MGFLDDYDVDPTEYEAGFVDAPAGQYEFTVSNGKLHTTDSDEAFIVINFSLENGDGETFSKGWWLKVPEDRDRATAREKRDMSDWKNWCLGSGFTAEEIRSVGPDDVEGISGTVRLVDSKPTKDGRVFQNFRDWAFDGAAEAPEATPEPVKKAPVKKAETPAEKAAPAASAGKPNPFTKK